MVRPLGDIAEVLETTVKLLTFQKAVVDQKRLGLLYLFFGLYLAWLAGIARHWDNPNVELWQRGGLDSVAYVFVFAFVLWVVIWPMRPSNWSYETVLIFVALTSPPAFLYALPSLLVPDTPENHILHIGTRWFFHDEFVASTKVWLLLIVAIWRVVLLAKFLYRPAGLRGGELVVGVLLPLILIVVTLTFLNLDRAVFDVMGGRQTHTADDGAYAVLNLITFLSVCLFPFVLIWYVRICSAREKRNIGRE